MAFSWPFRWSAWLGAFQYYCRTLLSHVTTAPIPPPTSIRAIFSAFRFKAASWRGASRRPSQFSVDKAHGVKATETPSNKRPLSIGSCFSVPYQQWSNEIAGYHRDEEPWHGFRALYVHGRFVRRNSWLHDMEYPGFHRATRSFLETSH